MIKESKENIILRSPVETDGIEIQNLVMRSKPLDQNSLYCCLLICTHFSLTSIVAENSSGIAGFISAYRIPEQSHTLFIWQVAVDSTMRKKGLAMSMIKDLLNRENLRDISFIETTVTPSNKASASFFSSLSSDLKTKCRVTEHFRSELLGSEGHEEEKLFRIGPFNIKSEK